MDVPGGSDGKVSDYNVGELGSIPRLGRSSGEGNGKPNQYSCLGNPMDGGAPVGYSPWGHRRVGLNLATKQENWPIQIFNNFNSIFIPFYSKTFLLLKNTF